MRLLRQLAGSCYRRRIRSFDKLNENVDFFATIPSLFSSAERAADRTALHRYVNDVTLHNAPLDYLEFGVFEGDSLRQWLQMNRHPSSRFTGFDTFTGLPEDWTSDKRAGTFDVQGKLPQLSDRARASCQDSFSRLWPGLCDPFPSSIGSSFILTVICTPRPCSAWPHSIRSCQQEPW